MVPHWDNDGTIVVNVRAEWITPPSLILCLPEPFSSFLIKLYLTTIRCPAFGLNDSHLPPVECYCVEPVPTHTKGLKTCDTPQLQAKYAHIKDIDKKFNRRNSCPAVRLTGISLFVLKLYCINLCTTCNVVSYLKVIKVNCQSVLRSARWKGAGSAFRHFLRKNLEGDATDQSLPISWNVCCPQGAHKPTFVYFQSWIFTRRFSLPSSRDPPFLCTTTFSPSPKESFCDRRSSRMITMIMEK